MPSWCSALLVMYIVNIKVRVSTIHKFENVGEMAKKEGFT